VKTLLKAQGKVYPSEPIYPVKIYSFLKLLWQISIMKRRKTQIRVILGGCVCQRGGVYSAIEVVVPTGIEPVFSA
jgi:hypothetical protein